MVMRNIVTVIEKTICEDKIIKERFLVEINVDNECIFQTTCTLKELYEYWMNKKQYKVIFECEVKFNTISIDEYDSEYDVTLNTYTLYENEESYKDEHIGTWKRVETAIKKANEVCKNNYALEVIQNL
jgi:hypothetical protein